jgi:hypothetical protein
MIGGALDVGEDLHIARQERVGVIAEPELTPTRVCDGDGFWVAALRHPRPDVAQRLVGRHLERAREGSRQPVRLRALQFALREGM